MHIYREYMRLEMIAWGLFNKSSKKRKYTREERI